MRPAYMLILGEDEAANQTVSIGRNGDQCNGIPLDQFVSDLFAEITTEREGLVPASE